MKAWTIYAVGMVVFVVTSLSISLLMGHGQFLIWLTNHRTPVLDYFFYYMTKFGEEYVFIVVGVLYLLRDWRISLLIGVNGLLATVLTYVLKRAAHFERPYLYLTRIGWEGPMGVLDYPMLTGHSSFPSGHTMAAWGFFTFMVAIHRKPFMAIVSLFIVVIVAISRVYLMAHFLRDVAVGAAIGFGIGYLLYYIYDSRLAVKQLGA